MIKREENLKNQKQVRWSTFLKDVFICSLGAYGGPEAHYGVFTDQMVIKKDYLTEEELVELIALTGILPGPSSTQTIVAIGHKIGGPLLAFLTMLVWALPVFTVMTLLSFLSQFLGVMNISQDGLRYIGPMAVGFIIVAAYRIGRKVVKDKITLALLLLWSHIHLLDKGSLDLSSSPVYWWCGKYCYFWREKFMESCKIKSALGIFDYLWDFCNRQSSSYILYGITELSTYLKVSTAMVIW
jgi:chromate transport protein ChrA